MAGKRSLRICSVVLVVLGVAGVADAAPGVPETVSPGAEGRVVRVAGPCPSFSWGAVAVAVTWELVAYETGGTESGGRPVLAVVIPGSALSWTPSLGECLEPGRRYVWFVRAIGAEGPGEWSRGRLFEIVDVPTIAEVEEALRVLERFVEARAEPDGPGEAIVDTDREPVIDGEADDVLMVEEPALPAGGVEIAESSITIGGEEVVTTANDQDTLGGMSCADGQLAKWHAGSSTWMCGQYSAGEHLFLDIDTFHVEDGSGSGLDADLFDGNESSDFAQLGLASAFTAYPVNASVGGGPLFINPPTGVKEDNTLLGAAVGGAQKFRVDIEGDVELAGSINKGLAVMPEVVSGLGFASPNVLAGHSSNQVAAGVAGAGIGGGGARRVSDGALFGNMVTDDFGSVGGGLGNRAGDGAGTTSDKRHATVGGGNGNVAAGLGSVVGGGVGNDATGDFALVAGGSGNEASGEYAVISGGLSNEARTLSASISGGESNIVADRWGAVSGGAYNFAGDGAGTVSDEEFAAVGGGYGNEARAGRATIAGGYDNLVSDRSGTIGGGSENRAGDAAGTTSDRTGATVGGGTQNVASGQGSVVGGGGGNIASGSLTTISGGGTNSAEGSAATVGGGQFNKARTENATIAGGDNNQVLDDGGSVGGGYLNYAGDLAGGTGDNTYATVAGGAQNKAEGGFGSVGGGSGNRVTDDYGTVGGGRDNRAGDAAGTTADKPDATVAGGSGNHAAGQAASIGGGSGNAASGRRATIAGGSGNTASAEFAGVAGGSSNSASGFASTVSGGELNDASRSYASVGGGENNEAAGTSATVGGGFGNRAVDDFSTVGGGQNNRAGESVDPAFPGTNATVAGGSDNVASERHSSVLGGWQNEASATYATVLGGRENTASGVASLAAGWGSTARHDNSFVWCSVHDCWSTATGQFTLGIGSSFRVLAGGAGAEVFAVDADGRLSVPGSSGTNAASFVKGSGSPGTGAAVEVVNSTNFGEAAWFKQGNPLTVQPVMKLVLPDGILTSVGRNFLECAVDGNPVVRKCHIDKYGTYHSGSDFAEALPALGERSGYRPGDVLLIAEDGSGVEKVAEPYSPRVAGVFSTRPGVLGADKNGETRVDERDVPVAIVGIVPTRVTTENGEIAVGDLLVNSATAGYAMKGTDRARMQGAIVGKALEAFTGERGVIRVLVSIL